MTSKVVVLAEHRAMTVSHVFKEIVVSNQFEARDKLQIELMKTKISMQDLAQIAGVLPQTVSRLRAGETFDPRLKTLFGLYKALNIRLIVEP